MELAPRQNTFSFWWSFCQENKAFRDRFCEGCSHLTDNPSLSLMLYITLKMLLDFDTHWFAVKKVVGHCKAFSGATEKHPFKELRRKKESSPFCFFQ
jgi:hypothetical protein